MKVNLEVKTDGAHYVGDLDDAQADLKPELSSEEYDLLGQLVHYATELIRSQAYVKSDDEFKVLLSADDKNCSIELRK